MRGKFAGESPLWVGDIEYKNTVCCMKKARSTQRNENVFENAGGMLVRASPPSQSASAYQRILDNTTAEIARRWICIGSGLSLRQRLQVCSIVVRSVKKLLTEQESVSCDGADLKTNSLAPFLRMFRGREQKVSGESMHSS